MLSHAVMFPGQGSQSVGMLGELATQYPLITEIFQRVSDRLGYDVWELVQQGPLEVLNQTMHTQVAVLTADVALYRLMQQQNGFKPSVLAGHSLGEYAALVCADAISLEDAAALVRTRGQVMQDNVPLGMGAMAAIVGLSDEQVIELCQQSSTADAQVMPANFNAIGQVVIAGHATAVDKAISQAQTLNARMAKVIPVSVPCHCQLLEPASEQFAEALEKAAFSIPTLPVISNVDLSIYQSVSQIRTLLKQQLFSPVRWVETIQQMRGKNIELVIECGPGKVLSGLAKRIDNYLEIKHASEYLVE